MTSDMHNILKAVLDFEERDEHRFEKWLLNLFKEASNTNCSIEDFAIFFLNFIKKYTEMHVKPAAANDTPKAQTPVKVGYANANADESTASPRSLLLHMQQTETFTPNQSRNLDAFQNSGSVDWGSHSMPRLSASVDSPRHESSTPNRQNVSSSSRKQSHTPSSSLCLGDFLVLNTSYRSQKKKNTSGSSSVKNQSTQKLEKPKKRVQPISIGKNVGSPCNAAFLFPGESSFSNENNILKISSTEVEDKEQCAVLEARKKLKAKARDITQELEEASLKQSESMAHKVTFATSTPSKRNISTSNAGQPSQTSFDDLENDAALQRLAAIYTIILNRHLTLNVLNELSFLLNLINVYAVLNPSSAAEEMHAWQMDDDEEEKSLFPKFNCLKNLRSAVYFALLCLNKQKYLMASLDTHTLKVVISSEGFVYLQEEVQSYILETYQKKMQLISESPMHDNSFCLPEAKVSANVYFQQDQDSRNNFTSTNEFSKFRAQRDTFYKCLKIWESYHLNPNWKFSDEIVPLIQEIFKLSENFVNMTHFAKLFVSQLLLSATNVTSPEEIGLDVDVQKLSRLTQRLIAPSKFSVDFQFPHSQAFFRDFILMAQSVAFVEQLKMALYQELMALNNSSFDHVNVTKNDEDQVDPDNSFLGLFGNEQFTVKAEVLTSMLILAKFLGFTITLPYVSGEEDQSKISFEIEKQQITLRNFTQPNFDLYAVLRESLEENKLLVTIPWMVQYLYMLDNISLQLRGHVTALNMLFCLHWHLAKHSAEALHPTAKFIIFFSVCWLIDSRPIIVEMFDSFRLKPVVKEYARELELIKNKLGVVSTRASDAPTERQPNAILEALMPIACPFLAEFRVSIMPSKYAQIKYPSRTGRYRHITTRIADFSSTKAADDTDEKGSSNTNSPRAVQKNLIQAFLHSQNSSTRQVLSFCTERCYKAVVKDGQLKILLPAKSKADAKINKINSKEYNVVFRTIRTIYKEAHREACTQWTASVPRMLEKRIKGALENLLTEEISEVLMKTYFMIIKRDASAKINNWFYLNIIKDKYFCVDLMYIANKLCTATKSMPSEMRILADRPSVSQSLSSLQYWLHCTSVRQELFKDSKPIVDLLQDLVSCFENVLPYSLYLLLSTNVIQLVQQIIATNCSLLTHELMMAACRLWMHPNMQRAMTENDPANAEEETTSEGADPVSNKDCIFEALVTIQYLRLLGSRSECYAKYGELIVLMIREDVVCLNFVNDLFIPIFKQDWHPQELNEISNMLRHIAQATATLLSPSKCSNKFCDDGGDGDNDDVDKSVLFMDLLADLSRDVDIY